MFIEWELPLKLQNNTAWRLLSEQITNLLGGFSAGESIAPHLKVVLKVTPTHKIEAGKGFVSVPENWLNQIGRALNTFSPAESQGDLFPNSFDRELRDLKRAIRAALAGDFFIEKCIWPKNAPLAIALTHDVDLTRKYGLKEILRLLASGRAAQAGRLGAGIIRGENPYWVFPEMLALYRKKGIKATYFFLAKAWEGKSYRYWIGSPKFKRLLRTIEQEGHQVGLHSSLNAHLQQKYLQIEKKRLEKVLGKPVPWVRQHYLKCRFPEAWYHYRNAGLLYDSSVGLNSGTGFPASTCFPYPALDWEKGESLGIWEVPFALQDYTWKNSAETGKLLERLLKMVEEVSGLLVINWHPSNLAEKDFSPLWETLLEQISSRDAYKGTLAEIMNWWQIRRNIRLADARVEGNRVTFAVELNESVAGLCLRVNARWQIENREVELLRQNANGESVYCLPHLPAGRFTLNLRKL